MACSVLSGLIALALLMAPLRAHTQATVGADAVYTRVAAVPGGVNGYGLGQFQFDPDSRRLFAISTNGLYWCDIDAPKPAWNGPTIKAPMNLLRLAPQLKRLFFATREELGYVDLDALDTPHLYAKVRAGTMVYEPERSEIYVGYRSEQVLVFNARTGERSDSIRVPGWSGQLLEAIPGRVFLTVPNKNGLYMINASSHRVGPWPVDGKIVTPMRIEVDPTGRYIFGAYYQNIVAIDTVTAKVVGRLDSIGTASIAYDPGAQLLIVNAVTQPSPARITAYRVSDTGFTLAATMKSPEDDAITLEPTGRGFLQRSRFQWLIWKMDTRRE